MNLRLGLVLMLGAQASACASSRDFVTGERTINRFSVEEEAALGLKHATVVIASYESLGRAVDPDNLITRTIRRVTSEILSVPANRARMPPFQWEVHVVDDPTPNALCFPGGQIVVMSGLLTSGFVRDEDEVAAIIGHELAHGASRHGTERRTLKRFKNLTGPVGRFFGPRIVQLLHPRDADRVIRELSANTLEYSRQQELEADLVGLELMARAGYEPISARRIWARNSRMRSSSDYPTHQKRMLEIDRHLGAALYVRDRSGARTPERTGWVFEPSARYDTTDRITEKVPLPRGARVPSTYVKDARLARIEVHAERRGKDVVVHTNIYTARSVHEDRLPLSAAVYLMDGRRVSRSARLAVGEPWPYQQRTKVTRFTDVAKGPRRVLVRATIGSVWAERSGRLNGG